MTADYTKIFNSYNGVGLSGNTPIFGGTGTPDTDVTGSPPDGSIYHRSNGEMYKRISSSWVKVLEADGAAVTADQLGGIDAANYARTDIAETFDNNVTLSGGTLDVTGQIDVDNITLNGNTISTTDTNGDLTLAPDGTGTVIITGDLTVNGTTTTVNSNEVNIGDNIIVLNSDEVGTPTQDGGVEIERGTSTNAKVFWNETTDKWQVDQGTGSGTNILTVADEGTGNGLDADTVDGLEASQFVRSDTDDSLVGNYDITGSLDVDNLTLDGNTLSSASGALTVSSASGDITLSPVGNATVDGNRILTTADEGAGNGLDADTLDGQEGSSYVRSDQNDSLTGDYTITGLLDVDNLRLDGNAITSTDVNGDITITPNGTGDIVLDGQNWPQADGSADQVLTTNGAGQLAWADPDSAQITADSVTTEATLDSVSVDTVVGVSWKVAAYETGTNNVEYVEVRAIHNGITGDATVVDQAHYAQLQTAAIAGLTVNVDLNGTGGSQVMRLRVAATNATHFRAIRSRINL